MKFLLLILIFANAVQGNAAGLFRIESETMFSLRNDYNQKLEAPFYEYFGASYKTFDQSLTFDSNFSVYANPNKSGENSFDLYLLNASYEIIPDKFIVQAGRSADFNRSTRTLLSDQLSLQYHLWEKRGTLGTFYGIERDIGDINNDYNSKQFGAKFDYHTMSAIPYYVSTKLLKEKNKYYSEDYVSLGLHGPLVENWWGSEFLFSGEHNITQTQTRRLETGIDFYPSMQFANRWRFLSYKARPLVGEAYDPIFAVISRGRLYEVSTALDYLYLTHLTFSGSFSFDDYLLQETTRTNGYRTEFNINYYRAGFTLSDKVYYFQSYGGKIWGNRVALILKMFSPYEVSGSCDVTYYSKITSAKGTALSSDLLFGKIFKDFKWQIGSEFNSNNFLPYDFRVLTKLTYTGWSEYND